MKLAKHILIALRISYHAFMAGFYNGHNLLSSQFAKWVYHSNEYVRLINQLKEN